MPAVFQQDSIDPFAVFKSISIGEAMMSLEQAMDYAKRCGAGNMMAVLEDLNETSENRYTVCHAPGGVVATGSGKKVVWIGR